MKSVLSLKDTVRDCLTSLVPRKDRPGKFVLAFSGGPDSTALLLLAAQLVRANELGCELLAGHVNYGLRGADSDADEEFCRVVCEAQAIQLIVKRIEPADASEKTLRTLRYDFLEATAMAHGADAILMAHTLDDQIETMLFRLFRGTAVAGLTGIPARRSSHSGMAIVRPLLSVRRSDIESFLQENDVVARTDASNLSNDYARNYIRNELVPRIESRFPGFVERMEQLRSTLQIEDTFMEHLATATMHGWKMTERDGNAPAEAELFEQLKPNPALARRVLVRVLRERDIEVNYERVETLLGCLNDGYGSVSLSERWDAVINDGQLVFLDKSIGDTHRDESNVAHKVRVPGQTMALDLGFALRIEEFAGSDAELRYPQSNSWEALVDLSECDDHLAFRVRRDGDVMKPFGMQECVRLKKFLHTHARSNAAWSAGGNLIVLADEQEVLWVPGVGLSDRLRVHSRPTHVLRLMKIAADDVKLS
ncbi:MAG: tRNA lysidine(34) synthetase TilS [Candidatus Obscuribacterales bacterium]